MKNVIITGASGMVGGYALQHLLAHKDVATVTSLVRKPSGKIHEKLKEIIHYDFSDYSSIANVLANQDAALFCIGVYTGAVPKETFHEITVTYPLQFGKALKASSADVRFCLLSGQGADRTEKSRTMFARDKGIAENGLAAINPGRFHAFRPAYIYPDEPRNEPNFMYKLSRWLYKPIVKPLGPKYSIKASELALAMVHVALSGTANEVLENQDILAEAHMATL